MGRGRTDPVCTCTYMCIEACEEQRDGTISDGGESSILKEPGRFVNSFAWQEIDCRFYQSFYHICNNPSLRDQQINLEYIF